MYIKIYIRSQLVPLRQLNILLGKNQIRRCVLQKRRTSFLTQKTGKKWIYCSDDRTTYRFGGRGKNVTELLPKEN